MSKGLWLLAAFAEEPAGSLLVQQTLSSASRRFAGDLPWCSPLFRYRCFERATALPELFASFAITQISLLQELL